MMKTFFGGLSGAVVAICMICLPILSPIEEHLGTLLIYLILGSSPLIILIGIVTGVSLVDAKKVVDKPVIQDNDALNTRFEFVDVD